MKTREIFKNLENPHKVGVRIYDGIVKLLTLADVETISLDYCPESDEIKMKAVLPLWYAQDEKIEMCFHWSGEKNYRYIGGPRYISVTSRLLGASRPALGTQEYERYGRSGKRNFYGSPVGYNKKYNFYSDADCVYTNLLNFVNYYADEIPKFKFTAFRVLLEQAGIKC